MTDLKNARELKEKDILEALQRLEKRVGRLEEHLGLDESALKAAETPSREQGPGLEIRIGEYGLAWAGSIILFLGLAFLMAYARNQGYMVVAAGIGYFCAAGLYLLGRLWRTSLQHISSIMTAGGLLLLYYSTVRLHFYSTTPLLKTAAPVLVLLNLVVLLIFYLALKRGSQPLAGLGMLTAMLTALLSDAGLVSLAMIAGFSLLAACLAIRFRWGYFLTFSIFLAYAAHLVWLLNNPLMGHPLQSVSPQHYSLAFLFVTAAAFALPSLMLKAGSFDEAALVAWVLLNDLGFSVLLTLAVMALYAQGYPGIYLGAAGFLILLSASQWLIARREAVPAFHACFGFLALSVAFYGYAGVPRAFLWLSLQSLMVVSMALWFRSRILVVANSLIYFSIMAVYLIFFHSSVPVDFSFALVAIASARVMNWKKERLTLRTDNFRNIYLAVAFVLVLYSIDRAVPAGYVTPAWTAAALAYFGISFLLHNIKYRWMAILTVLASVLHLFLIDLPRLDPRLRVASFLFLGLMAIVISLLYSRIRRLLGKN